jgi:hypothetical protein
MSLQTYLACLSIEQLVILHDDIINASLINENNNEYKDYFAAIRKNATGKRKKIYAALKKSSKKEVENMADAIILLIKSKRIVC